jgi:hypothetical protein
LSGAHLRVDFGPGFHHRSLIGVAAVEVCGVTAGHFERPLAATGGEELKQSVTGRLRI